MWCSAWVGSAGLIFVCGLLGCASDKGAATGGSAGKSSSASGGDGAGAAGSAHSGGTNAGGAGINTGGATGAAGLQSSGGVAPVLDGEWHGPETVSTSSGDSTVLGLGACGNGEAIILFSSHGSPTSQLLFSRYVTTLGGWSNPQLLGAGHWLGESTTRLAVNAQCDALLVWSGDAANSGDPVFMGAAYDHSAGWGPAKELTPDDTLPQAGSLELGISDTGEGAIAYISGGKGLRIDYTHSSGFSTAAMVNAEGTSVTLMLLGVLGDGRGVQLYRQFEGGAFTFRTLLRAADGTWTPGPTLDGAFEFDSFRTAETRFLLTGVLPPTPFTAVLNSAGELVQLPAPGELPLANLRSGPGATISGNSDVIFFLTRMSDTTLKASKYDLSSGWAASASLARNDFVSRTYDIVVDHAGRAMAYYATTDDDLVANRFTPSRGWSGPILLAKTQFAGGTSHVSMDSNGNVVIAWDYLGGSLTSLSHGVAALRYVIE